jgi:hypothetical protein
MGFHLGSTKKKLRKLLTYGNLFRVSIEASQFACECVAGLSGIVKTL